MLAIVGGADTETTKMATTLGVPPLTALKIREFAGVFAVMMLALDPDYDFTRSNFASSDLNITDIMCRAAVLSSALESIRRNSINC